MIFMTIIMFILSLINIVCTIALAMSEGQNENAGIVLVLTSIAMVCTTAITMGMSFG